MKNAKPGDVKVDVDTALCPAEAVEAAGFMFEGRAQVRISRRGSGCLAVNLSPTASSGSAALEGEFRNELLHQALRLKVSKSSRNIREYIVTKALLSAQQPSILPISPPPQEEPCPECQASALPGEQGGNDPELEAEIEKLLSEIEKGAPGGDPLGVAVPWEEKFGKKGGSGRKKAKKA